MVDATKARQTQTLITMTSPRLKTIPRELRGTKLHHLFAQLSNKLQNVRSTYLGHQNILSNRITSLEKRRYELHQAYRQTDKELEFEINLLKLEHANRKSAENRAAQV